MKMEDYLIKMSWNTKIGYNLKQILEMFKVLS